MRSIAFGKAQRDTTAMLGALRQPQEEEDSGGHWKKDESWPAKNKTKKNAMPGLLASALLASALATKAGTPPRHHIMLLLAVSSHPTPNPKSAKRASSAFFIMLSH